MLEIWQVDAFTSVPFGGNPAGVVPDARGLTSAQMQKIAREMNLSETAFVFPLEPGDAQPDFEVRFFTPLAEVDLCGHATIATFASLVQEGRLAPGTWHQKTAAGILPVRVDRGDPPGDPRQNPRADPRPDPQGDPRGRPVHVLMGQAEPVYRGHLDPASLQELAICLRTDPSQLQTTVTPAGSDKMVTVIPGIVSTGIFDLLVPLPDRKTLWNLSPDFAHLADFCRRHQVISTHCFTFDPLAPAPATVPGDPHPPVVVHCRDFSPAVGINEESATGTASGALGAYLAITGLLPSGILRCEQGHILGRPSIIDVVIPNNREVWVGGTAILVMRGQIMIPQPTDGSHPTAD